MDKVLKAVAPTTHDQDETLMTFEDWKAKTEQKAKRDQERQKIEMVFNAEILRRHKLGESKEEIVASMGISRELFNRVVRSSRRVV
jgi:predicted DNA-binding protein (UPF0251 family)